MSRGRPLCLIGWCLYKAHQSDATLLCAIEYVYLYILCQPVHVLCCSTAFLHRYVYACAQEAALERGRGEGAKVEVLKKNRIEKKNRIQKKKTEDSREKTEEGADSKKRYFEHLNILY